MSNVLDLTGANTEGFSALDSGRYNAVVHEAEMTETKGGPDAKLPEGTPMLKIQFRITEEGIDNRRAFGNYITSFPKDYEPDKVARMKGNLVNLFTALGYNPEDIAKGKFSLDVEDLVGRECSVILGQKPRRDDPTEMENKLNGVKPKKDGSEGSSGSPLL